MKISTRLAVSSAAVLALTVLTTNLTHAQRDIHASRVAAEGVGNVPGFQRAGELEAVKKFKELQAAGIASSTKGARHAPNTVYVFGDSMSDTGNS